MSQSSRTSPATRWGFVILLILAGIVSAFQVGKAAIAVPLLQDDLGISLVFASWIVGAFGALGAAAGLAAGIVASLFAPRGTLIAGLLVTGAASLAGAAATGGGFLLATRIAEGCGFLAIALSVPRLLRAVSAPADQARVFAFWGTYMPFGTAIMMLCGPLAAGIGWPILWLINAAIALGYAGLLACLAIPSVTSPPANARAVLANVASVLRAPGPVLLALAFGFYTFQYFALTGLMPALLVERLGLSIATAGIVSAMTVLANGFGNLLAGVVLRHGIPFWIITSAAFAVAGIASFGIFSSAMPVAGVALIAAAALAVSGLIPASIFAAAPRFAPTSAMLAITLGLIMQGSNGGQLLGPAALASFAERYGWDNAPVLFVGIAAAGIAVTAGLRIVMRQKQNSASCGRSNMPHQK